MSTAHRVIPLIPADTAANAPGIAPALKIQARHIRGRYSRWRWAIVALTQLVFCGLPWLTWNGRQAVWFDLEGLRFFLFDAVLFPQDLSYLTGLLVCAALLLFAATSIAGRVWCGFACPQTVYTAMFMWIEQRVEGDRSARLRLDKAAWGPDKLMRRVGKHGAWIALSLLTGFSLVAWFTPARSLAAALPALAWGPWETFWILFYAAATYLHAGLLREKVCQHACPYGRFQGAMLDAKTLVVGYDQARGEPRAPRPRGQAARAAAQAQGRGDCIDCTLCVQVCPVGIDIRQGLQAACISCGLCIDACNQVMDKLGQPRGLVRFGATQAQGPSTGSWRHALARPRVVIYTGVLLSLAAAMSWSWLERPTLRLNAVRDRSTLARIVDDGWVENTVNGDKLNEINRRGLRGQVLVKPHNDFNLRLIAEYNRENSSTGTLVPYSFGPLNRGTFNSATNYTTFPQAAVAVGAQPLVTDPYKYKVSLDGPQQAKVEQSAVSAEANWNLGGYRLTSITAWRDWHFDPKNDLDYTNLPGLTGGFKSKEEQFSQEVRLASPTGGAVDYVVGGYYYHQRTSSDNSYTTGPSVLALSGGSYPNNNVVSGRGEATTDSLAAFGQTTWHVTPKLDLTGGLRYTTEDKKGRVQQNDLASASPFSALPIFRAWDSGELKRTDESVAALLNASYKLTPTVLGFVNVSHGQKSGGYNVNSVASAGSAFGTQAITVDPEKANNIDLGIKSTWLNNRVQVNGNFFLTKVKDYQAVTNTYYAPAAIFLGVLTNVGDVTSKGFEFDVKARATNNLTLNLNGAYTLARFDSGTGPTPFEVYNGTYGRGSQSIEGNQVNGAPKWIFNAGAQYRHFLDNGIEQRLVANYAWRDQTYGDINNSVYSKIESYGLLNLSAGWRIPQGEKSSWDVSLWVKNAFDKRYFLRLTTAGSNMYVGSAGESRTVGATVRYDFY